MKKGEWRPARIRSLERAVRNLKLRNKSYYALCIESHEYKIKKLKEGIERDKKKELLK